MKDKFVMIFGRCIEPQLKVNLEELCWKNNFSCFDVKVETLADGEILPTIPNSVRGLNVFLFHSTAQTDTNIIELLLTIDALKRASAETITIIIPYFGYARQDRKTHGREPISAACIAKCIKLVGADRIVCVDLHAGQIQGFVDGPMDDLKTAKLFVKNIKNDFGQIGNLVIASPDAGGAKRAEAMCQLISPDTTFVICHKQRNGRDKINSFKIIGDVVGKDIVIVDDVTSTCSTLYKSSKAMLDAGAKTVSVAVVHFACSPDRCLKITKEFDWKIIYKKYTSNSHPQSCLAQKMLGFEIIDLSELLFETTKRIIFHESVSSLF